MKTYQKILIGVGCAILAPLLVLMEVNRNARGIEKSHFLAEVTWPLHKSFGIYDIELAAIEDQARKSITEAKGDVRKGVAAKADLARYWMAYFENKGYGYYMPMVREDISAAVYGMSYDQVTKLTGIVEAGDQLLTMISDLSGIPVSQEPTARYRKVGNEERIAVSEIDLPGGKKIAVSYKTANGRYENIPGFFRTDELAWWENSENADGGYVLITRNQPPGLPSNCPKQTDPVWLFVTSDRPQEPKVFACGEPARGSENESVSQIFVINNTEGKREHAIVVYKKSEKVGEVIYLDNNLNIVNRERLDGTVVARVKKTFREDAEIAISLKSQR